MALLALYFGRVRHLSYEAGLRIIDELSALPGHVEEALDTNNEARRAVLNGSTWTLTDLRAGGREMHVSMDSLGHLAYSSLNEAVGLLTVYVI